MDNFKELCAILHSRVGVLESHWSRVGKFVRGLQKEEVTEAELNGYIDWYMQDDWRVIHRPMTIGIVMGSIENDQSFLGWLGTYRAGRLLMYTGESGAPYQMRPGLFDLELPSKEIVDPCFTCHNLPWLAEYWVVQWYRTAGSKFPSGLEFWNQARLSLLYLPLIVELAEPSRMVCHRKLSQVLAHLRVEREWLFDKAHPGAVQLLQGAISTVLESIAVTKFRFHDV